MMLLLSFSKMRRGLSEIWSTITRRSGRRGKRTVTTLRSTSRDRGTSGYSKTTIDGFGAKLTPTRFCRSLGVEPDETIKRADVAVFKAFLDWRVENGRITKLSTIKSYWKSLSLVYAATARCWLDQATLYDMSNVSPNAKISGPTLTNSVVPESRPSEKAPA